ncbi:uncharacterized protein LTR77_001491 [Saxophila tyrrhenica]|uniref:TAFII55 protein conserved region domain-containing protein n=1 Tax=Saxophila tyrrhenica TaxID=1690608 RepID=A0AAV9PNE9_9PEZI|nr:hypothetical protein LTR77_001491 [Saxophila tyrrhenica]
MVKLTLKTGKAASPDASAQPDPPPSIPPTPASTTSNTGFKLSLKNSAAPTPATEQPPPKPKKQPSQQAKKSKPPANGSKKRAANDDTISPAAKRLAAPSRKISLNIGKAAAQQFANDGPNSAGGSNKILLKRKPTTGPKIRALTAARKPPPRLPGLGYDSEDSDAEADPTIQQAFILRMQPGEDCDYLHDAIANGKVGLPISEGGAEVSFKFLETNMRRAMVTIRGRMYAAVLVDLPCIVETMKSWDKKGWWKVADLCQILLVLGRCHSEEDAKTYALPKEVDKETHQYAHGLTPPMHWVRKRRFRKRLSYKAIANVDEEVERLLREDEQAEETGGSVSTKMIDPNRPDRGVNESEADDYESQDALETIENGQQAGEEEYLDDEAFDLEGGLQAAFDEEAEEAFTSEPVAADIVSASPAPIQDQAPSFAAATTALESAAPTPAAEGETDIDAPGDADSSSEDEDEDASDEEEDSPDVLDEDAAARAAERNQQLEEVADLEREIASQRRKVASMSNQLLKQRAEAQLRNLEEDLRVKRGVFGLEEEDEEVGGGRGEEEGGA